MLENEEEIRRLSNYGIGALYKCNSSNGELEQIKKMISNFDTGTYNFHLYPEDIDERDRIKCEIETCHKNVKKNLKDQIKDNKHDITLCQDGVSKHEELKMFRYIAAKKNGIKYELNFMRFFIDKDKKVNCILKAIQFDRCIGEYVNVSLDKDKKCDICYPTSYRSQNNDWLEKTLKCREGKSFCFNPGVSFYDSEKVADAFIAFINACDEQFKENEVKH